MAWRKRRRYRLASIVSYLCAFFGVLFIVGNVVMLREGFVQLYATAFHERPPRGNQYPVQMEHLQAQYHHQDIASHAHFDQLFPIELPSAALKSETHLRKLMESRVHSSSERHATWQQYVKNPELPSSTLSSSTTGSINRASRLPQRADSSVIHVTSQDLRKSLYITSDCAGLANRTKMTLIGSGWTKLVYRSRYKNGEVALKMVDPEGHDVTTCLEQNKALKKNWTYRQCYEQSVQKILKEIVLLRGLSHPHIVQALGHCVPEQPYVSVKDRAVTLATELGEPVDIIKLLHLSWEDRLGISYDLTKLLFYLAHSPFGSVLLNDFRRQQFVLVGGKLMLTDLDDMSFTESACITDRDCETYYSSVNVTLRTPCFQRRCSGLNEKKNVLNAARHFTTFLLPHGAPHSMRPRIDSLLDDYGNASKTSGSLLQQMAVIVEQYSSGSYLDRTDGRQTRYQSVPGKDVSAEYDYSCRYAMDKPGCSVSVYDQREAEELCDSDDMCRAFVMYRRRSWTGRTLVYFKSGVGRLKSSSTSTVFIKPGV